MVKRMDLLAKVRPFVGLDIVKVLTGLRRSGKSVLMRQIQDMILAEIDPAGKFVYVNLEEDENKKFIPKGRSPRPCGKNGRRQQACQDVCVP